MVFQLGRLSFGKISVKLSLYKGRQLNWFLVLGMFPILGDNADWICLVLGKGGWEVILFICTVYKYFTGNMAGNATLFPRAVDSSTGGRPLKIRKSHRTVIKMLDRDSLLRIV